MAGIKSDAKGNKSVTFRYAGRQFTKSAGTREQRTAEGVKARVEDVIFRLVRGYIALPDGADPGEFIISGGERPTKVVVATAALRPRLLTLADLIGIYDDHLPPGAKEGTTMGMEKIHKAHLLRVLGRDFPIESMTSSDAQRYANTRSREVYRGRSILPPTVLKELSTLRVIWNWNRRQGRVEGDIPFRSGDLDFARTQQKASFQTYDDIRKTIARGGLDEADQSLLWECLYLTIEEVHEVLGIIRARANHPFILPMFAMAAMTGARRSEICRSRIEDWDLANGTVNLREKKRKRGRSTFRSVDLNATLTTIMQDWLSQHPGGQFAIAKEGKPITVGMAHGFFKRTLKGTRWAVIPGFHTFRHSFASILASQGVDETTIDRWMGHQTQEQRERYRHLFPRNRRRAIESLCLP